MNIKCKSPGCPGFVAYQAIITDPVALQAVELVADVFDTMEVEKLEDAVKDVIKADTNKFTTTKTIYLTCDSVPSHTYGYPLPA